jgi:hypothetical protein
VPYSDPLADRRLTVLQGGSDDFTAYPASHAGWVNRYQYLIDAYHGETYTQQQIKELSLFRALDDDGKVIALTRRLHRDIQFIVDTARDALALGEVILQKPDGITDAEYQTALNIWERSDVHTQGSVWSLILACCGDLYLEAARVDSGSQDVSLISYPPQNVYLEYDMVTGRRITRAIVTSEVLGDATVDYQGNVTEAPALYTYQRTLTPDAITVESVLPDTEEGRTQRELDTSASGPHGLGVVPLTHIRCIPTIYPEHSLPVTHGIDRGLAEVDSAASQISAVGDRFGNPKPYLFGAKLGDTSAVSRFGRWLNAWGNNSDKIRAGYLEPTMQGVTQLQTALERLIRDIRLTFPEFLFVGGGSTAGLSGEALRLLSTRYETKYRDIRARAYRGIERALAIGVAMERRAQFDPGRLPVIVKGPPLLPADVKARLEALKMARDLGGVSTFDIIRATQELEIARGDVTAEEYASLIAEEEMGTAASILGDADDLEDRIEDAAADLEAAEETIQDMIGRAPDEMRDDLEDLLEAVSDAAEVLTDPDPGEGPDDDEEGAE